MASSAFIDTLKSTHQLANTYFVFTSDNGFHIGQFRMPAGKETAYDTDIHVPLIVRGPGVPAATTSNFMVGNIDLAPTFASLAGATIPGFVDGRSFAPLLHDPGSDPHPRHSYLVEHWKESRSDHLGPGPTEPGDLDRKGVPDVADIASGNVPPPARDYIPEFHGVRTEHYLYVEYSPTSRELYATDNDPYELHNLASNPHEARLVARLHKLVAELVVCKAAQCRVLEDQPVRGVAPDGARTSAGERIEPEAAADFGPAQRRQLLRRLTARRHLTEEPFGDRRDLERGQFHRAGDIDPRSRHARDLAHVLTGGGFDLLTGRGRVEPAELGDVSAHAASVGRSGRRLRPSFRRSALPGAAGN